MKKLLGERTRLQTETFFNGLSRKLIGGNRSRPNLDLLKAGRRRRLRLETLERRHLLAAVIAPVGAELMGVGDPSSYLEYDSAGNNWYNGSGLTDPTIVETGDPIPDAWPSHIVGHNATRTARIRNAAEVNTLTFDLGGSFDVNGMVLWNSTEANQTDRGFENTVLSYSTDGGLTFTGSDTLTWDELVEKGSPNLGNNPTDPAVFEPEVQMLPSLVTGVTHVRMDVDNFSESGADGIVMASEIRFLGNVDAGAAKISLNLTADMLLDSQALVFPDGARFSRDANGSPYRTEPLLTHGGYQFATWYNRGTGDGVGADIGISIARRELSSNTWEVRDTGLDMVNAQRIWDSHNVISLGIASDGRLHLAYDMHKNDLRYATTPAGRATGSDWHVFNAERDSLNSNSASLKDVTYPRFINNGDDMLMTFREGGSGNGDIELIRYDSSAALPHRWVDENGNPSSDLTQTIISGAGSYTNPIDNSVSTTRNAYLNGVDVDPSGRIHMTWTWRENSQGSNHDINYAYSDDNGATWRNNAGANLGATVSISSPGIIISSLDERQALINQQGQTVDNQGGVHALMYHRRQEPGFEWQQGDGLFFKGDSAYFHYYRDPISGIWTHSMLPTDRVVGSRPSIGFDSDNNLFAAYLTRANGNDILRIARAEKLASGGYAPWEVIGEDLRDWLGTPMLDQDRLLNDNILSIFLQENTTSDSLTGTNLRVLEYSIDKEVQTPYVARTITDGARIEAEEFDLGGSELAYSDSSPGNEGNVFRTDVDVDIYDATDGGPGFSVGKPNNDEWLEYTTDVVAGIYDIDFRLAANGNDTTRRVRLLVADSSDDTNFTELGVVSVPLTGSQSDWQSVTLSGIDLTPWAGANRVIRLELTGFNFQTNWFEFATSPPPELTLAMSAESISENGGTTTATVTRNSDTTDALVVSLFSDDTTEATVDGTVTIPAGATTSDIFVVSASNDEVIDDDQTVTITASAGGHIGASATVIVTDDESVSLSGELNTTFISEAGGEAVFTLRLESTSTSDLEFDLDFGGSALLGTHFNVDATTMSVPAGEGSAEVVLTAIDNALYEANRSIEIAVNPGPGLDGQTFVIEIIEDEVGGFSATSISEPIVVSESGTTQEIAVNLDTQPITRVTILASTSDPTEAVLDQSVLVFEPNNWDVPQFITVSGIGDLADDGDRPFSVSLGVDPEATEPGFANAGSVTLNGINADVVPTELVIELQNEELVVIDGDTGNRINVDSRADQTVVVDLSRLSARLTIGDLGDDARSIEIIHQQDDRLEFSDTWTVDMPQLVGEQLMHVMTHGAVTIGVVNEMPYQNPYQIWDIDRDGAVTALDALIGINRLNQTSDGSHLLPSPTPASFIEPHYYYDVTGDGNITALDSLRVINELIRREQQGNGEAIAASSITDAGAPMVAGFPTRVIDEDSHSISLSQYDRSGLDLDKDRTFDASFEVFRSSDDVERDEGGHRNDRAANALRLGEDEADKPILGHDGIETSKSTGVDNQVDAALLALLADG